MRVFGFVLAALLGLGTAQVVEAAWVKRTCVKMKMKCTKYHKKVRCLREYSRRYCAGWTKLCSKPKTKQYCRRWKSYKSRKACIKWKRGKCKKWRRRGKVRYCQSSAKPVCVKWIRRKRFPTRYCREYLPGGCAKKSGYRCTVWRYQSFCMYRNPKCKVQMNTCTKWKKIKCLKKIGKRRCKKWSKPY